MARSQPNVPTGHTGLVAVDKMANEILFLDPATFETVHVLSGFAARVHELAISPDHAWAFVPFTAPNGLAGLGLSPDGSRLVLVDAQRPELLLLDTATDEVVRRVRLPGRQAAQIARYSPDGRSLVVTSHDEGLGTILQADLEQPRVVQLGHGPMDMAFHPDGRTVVVGNQDDGTLTEVDLEQASVTRTVAAGAGVETLAFF